MTTAPSSLRWTMHALEKARRLGYPREQVERAVLTLHPARTLNPGSGSWRVTQGRLVIVYEHPDEGDSHRARIVTLWRRR